MSSRTRSLVPSIAPVVVRSIVRSIATMLVVASFLVPAASRAQDGATGTDAALPELTGRVVDVAGLLDPDRERALAAKLEAHEQASGDQVVVATVPSLGGADIADYGYRLGSAWRLGTAENDNGALLLVAPNERKVRIEVGRGLEGALTDARSGIIIRSEILPAFRDDDYATGIERGVDAILASIDGEYTAPADGGTGGRGAENPILDFVPLLFIAMVAVPQLLRRTGLRRAANGAFPAGFAGLFGTLASGSLWIGLGAAVLIFVLVFTMGGRGGGGGSRGSGVRRRGGGVLVGGGALGGGGLGGGGFGGGGFGGGGGGFSGGGASGGW